MLLMKNETEKAYPQQSTTDKDGEYSFLYTECGNSWYSVNTDPMKQDNCIYPKCGRIVKVVMENFMKKLFIFEENDVEELIKNTNITMVILDTVFRENKVDRIRAIGLCGICY